MTSFRHVAADRLFVAQKRQRILARLRKDINALEGVTPDFGADDHAAPVSQKRQFSFGVEPLDRALGDAFNWRGLCELHSATARDSGALTGFLAAVLARHTHIFGGEDPVLWIAPHHVLCEAGRPYGHGLAWLGFDPARLLFIAPRTIGDALWICEEAAATSGLCAVVVDMRAPKAGIGLRETRRLHMRAARTGLPVFLLQQSVQLAATSAPLRLTVAPRPCANDVLFAESEQAVIRRGGIGPPGFGITLDKNKSGPAGNTYRMYWNPHDSCFFTPHNQSNRARSSGSFPGAQSANVERQVHADLGALSAISANR